MIIKYSKRRARWLRKADTAREAIPKRNSSWEEVVETMRGLTEQGVDFLESTVGEKKEEVRKEEREWYGWNNFSLGIYRPYFPRPRKYRRLFSEPTYWRGAAEVHMARKIIKPVFSSPMEIESYPRKISSLTTVSLLEKRETKASSLYIANACKRSVGTGCQWWSPKWFRFFSTCIRQLADNPGE